MKAVFILILLSMLFLQCGENKEVKQLHNEHYKKDKTQFRLIRYYKTSKRMSEVQPETLGSLVEYYKYHYNKGAKLPFKEEYYKNQRLINYKTFVYKDGKGNLPEKKNVIYFDRFKNKIKEEIFKSKDKTIKYEYKYDKKTKKLLEKHRYMNDKADGRWLYYNEKGKLKKEDFYNQGKFLEYWVYRYNLKGKRISEEKYNAATGELIYEHRYD